MRNQETEAIRSLCVETSQALNELADTMNKLAAGFQGVQPPTNPQNLIHYFEQSAEQLHEKAHAMLQLANESS